MDRRLGIHLGNEITSAIRLETRLLAIDDEDDRCLNICTSVTLMQRNSLGNQQIRPSILHQKIQSVKTARQSSLESVC